MIRTVCTPIVPIWTLPEYTIMAIAREISIPQAIGGEFRVQVRINGDDNQRESDGVNVTDDCTFLNYPLLIKKAEPRIADNGFNSGTSRRKLKTARNPIAAYMTEETSNAFQGLVKQVSNWVSENWISPGLR